MEEQEQIMCSFALAAAVLNFSLFVVVVVVVVCGGVCVCLSGKVHNLITSLQIDIIFLWLFDVE